MMVHKEFAQSIGREVCENKGFNPKTQFYDTASGGNWRKNNC